MQINELHKATPLKRDIDIKGQSEDWQPRKAPVRKSPKYVHQFIDRHGVTRAYFRKKGFPPEPLPPVGTARFDAAYHKLLKQAGEGQRREISVFSNHRLHTAGYVYFLRRSDAIKIGWSKDPFGRAGDLKTGGHEKMESIVALRGTLRHERMLHRQFHQFRRNGEWFTAAPELVEFIARSLTMGRFEIEIAAGIDLEDKS